MKKIKDVCSSNLRFLSRVRHFINKRDKECCRICVAIALNYQLIKWLVTKRYLPKGFDLSKII